MVMIIIIIIKKNNNNNTDSGNNINNNDAFCQEYKALLSSIEKDIIKQGQFPSTPSSNYYCVSINFINH